MSPDIAEILNEFGLRILAVRCRKHLVVRVHRADTGEFSITFPSSPSDYRATKNWRSSVKKAIRHQQELHHAH